MATLPELARTHTRIDESGIEHLQRLLAVWGMLADLCFADLLLFAPVTAPIVWADGAGGTGSEVADAASDAAAASGQDEGGDGHTRMVVLGQMRPTTNPTLHRDDLVGRIVDETDREIVARAWRLGEIVEGEIEMASRGERARVQCIPVRWLGEKIAVMTREAPLQIGVGRRPGELERTYVEVFERFARMITTGDFPFPAEEEAAAEFPRVGDGVLLLDDTGRISYASPNAVNAMHRMGVYSGLEGVRMEEIGVEESAIAAAYAKAIPITEELERGSEVTVLLRCIPLIDQGRVTGAVVLMRDITDLRRRDRLILSKDATIREVHHRVKNNLQTISSLLRLQARRLPAGDGRTALNEAERRIRTIALVHEMLSRDARDQVDFNDIVRPLVRMAEDGMASPDRPVRLRSHGDAGELPAEVATPLAVVLTELLQNAVEHAFPMEVSDTEAGFFDGRVDVYLDNDGTRLRVRVHDNGAGLPEGFTLENASSLGLNIVRDLVTSQLGGTIEMRNENGTMVELTVPVHPVEPESP